MIPADVIEEISYIVGPEHLITEGDTLIEYGTDGTKIEYMPDAVAFPGNEKEIADIFKLANTTYFPIIPRGGGSGMSGGALPIKGGLILALDRLNRILRIDRENLIAVVEPAVITAHLQDEVEKVDLFYPPDPASADVATIGGNVAECAGGLRGLKYGVTRDYVLGLTVVLPNGEVIKTGGETIKDVAGYDLTRLIVGSEGTLAVVTSITLRLIPKPKMKKTMIAFFRNTASACRAIVNVIGGKIIPVTLEFLDRSSIDCVRDGIEIEIPDETDALLLIEVDGDEPIVEEDSEKIKTIIAGSDGIGFHTASNSKEAESLWKVRRELSPSMLKLRPNKVSEDVVVPRTRIPELILFLEKLSEKTGLPIPAFGHAGDGNIHVNIMMDKQNDDEVRKGETAIRELFSKVIELGGTITGEHGVGITKAPYLGMEFSESAIELMKRIKQAFDPKGILNPGKIFTNDH